MNQNWQGLQLLLKAPKKKYIKKLVQYAALISNSSSAVPNMVYTPISQDFTTDLELSSEQSHQLILSLIFFIKLAQQYDFQSDSLRRIIGESLSQDLIEILVQIVNKLSSGISTNIKDIHQKNIHEVKQSDRLIDFQWALQMEVASQKGKTNIPIVQLDLKTTKNSMLKQYIIELKGTQFQVFYKNLQKMKQQVTRLVSPTD